MTAQRTRPAPQGHRLSPLGASLLLYTGPLAWLLQLTIGEVLTSWPCFPGPEHLEAPLPGYDWTRIAAILLLIVCALAAWSAGFAAWRVFRSVRDEGKSGHDTLAEIGDGPTRFIALWGICLGFGFGAVTLLTLAGFALVPLCLG